MQGNAGRYNMLNDMLDSMLSFGSSGPQHVPLSVRFALQKAGQLLRGARHVV